VVFTAGSSTATIIVDPTSDLTAEPNETVSLTLDSGTDYTVGTTIAVIGTISNDDIIGTSTANTLTGSAINEFIDGRGGQDNLTGGIGPDRFGWRFGESRITKPDRITDFEFGVDKFDLFTSSGGALGAPSAFSRAADNSTARKLSDLATAVFSDANGVVSGSQALGANAAVLVTATNSAIAGTYIFINNSTKTLSTTSDLLINITGYQGSIPALGSLTIETVFI
jgi:Ca2+-binding RTX toxin-like protein